jgi:hypothetical protein
MTHSITDAELLEWERLAKEATPPEWNHFLDRRWMAGEQEIRYVDAEFVVAARSALPRLVEEVRRLRKILDEHEHWVRAHE